MKPTYSKALTKDLDMHMKPLSFLALFITFLLLCASCHKTTNQAPATKYRVTHIVDSANYYVDTFYEGLVVSNYTVSYTNNRISSIIADISNPLHITNISQSDTATFFFYSSTYAIHHTTYPFYRDSVFFNSLHQITASTGGINTASFSYNNNSQVTFYQVNGPVASSFGNNIWDAIGNISTTIASDTATVNYYTDELSTIGDYSELYNFLAFGNMIVHTKNLTRSIISPHRSINITYAFDNNGNIVNTRSQARVTNIYSGRTEITTHSYTLEYGTY